jgi:hypothetical protein
MVRSGRAISARRRATVEARRFGDAGTQLHLPLLVEYRQLGSDHDKRQIPVLNPRLAQRAVAQDVIEIVKPVSSLPAAVEEQNDGP